MGSNPIGALEMSTILVLITFENCSSKLTCCITGIFLAVLGADLHDTTFSKATSLRQACDMT